jgi:undecaprenyl-diphosphatase
VPHALRVVLPELPSAEPERSVEPPIVSSTSQGADPTAAEERAPTPPEATPAIEAAVRPMEARRRARLEVAQHVLIHGVKTFGAIDAGLFLRINGIRGGRTFDLLMSGVSRVMDLGEGWVVLALLVGLFAPATHGRISIEVIPALWLAMLTINFPIKLLFQRPRPFVAYVKARVVGGKPSDSSFPSGHTAAAFAGASLFSIHFPALAPLFYGYAITVGFSRVYLGVHYPSDVGIGALLGTMLALLYRSAIVTLLPH